MMGGESEMRTESPVLSCLYGFSREQCGTG